MIYATLIASLVLLSGYWPATQPPAPVCTIKSVETNRVVLADGRSMSVDARNAEGDENSLFIFGNSAYAWPVQGKPTAVPTRYLGVIRDFNGKFRPVALPAENAQAPQVTADGSGGWHVLYIEPLAERKPAFSSLDSATIWYAHFDGSQWSERRQLVKVGNAKLSTDFISGLTRIDDKLFFVFGFDQSGQTRSIAHGNQGFIMLSFRAGADKVSNVTLDTLYTSRDPRWVYTLPSTDARRVSVYVVHGQFNGKSSLPPVLAHHDYLDGWESATMVYPNPEPNISQPRVVRTNGEEIVTGTSFLWNSPTASLMTAPLAELRSAKAAPSKISILPTYSGYAAVSLDKHRTVWLTYLEESMRFFTEIDNSLKEFGATNIPSFSPNPVAVALSDSTLAVMTMVIDTSAVGEPTGAATLVSKVTLACR